MTSDSVARLLQDIDSVEADLRGLESRLTSVRERLRKWTLGENADIDVDGYSKRLKARRQEIQL
jgi:hypothetical protein